jgi:radical SAM superfamily enzyme YgiQ (UPF0313 family)
MIHGLIFSCRYNFYERGGGVHRIATILRQNSVDVEVVDFAPHWKIEELQEFVRKSVKSSTTFFAFGVFFNYWNPTVQQLVDWMKITYPTIKIIIGGQNVLHTLATNIDIWVDSYGELAILEVVKGLAGNTTSGIKFDIEHFGKRKVVKSLVSYPAHNMKDYAIYMQERDFVQPHEWLTVEFSRGCKFSCAFCNFPILGVKEDTSRTGESFEKELKYNFDNFGVTNYYVADETFNDRVEKIRKFADVVEPQSFKPFFSGFIRADLMPQNPEMLIDLARMNFGGQYYGIETFSREAGKIIGKGMDPERLKEYLLYTESYMNKHSSAYRGTISLIVGLPKETKDTWRSTVSWLIDNWQDNGLIVFPLDVPTLNNTATNQSKFTSNLAKYGLRPLSTYTPSEQKISKNDGEYWKEGNYGNELVLWEHDGMNIFEARQLVKDFIDDITYTFKSDSWSLHATEMQEGKKALDLKTAFDKNKFTCHIPLDSPVPAEFRQNYINRKLNQ